MVFDCSLIDSKSPQVSRTLLSIRAVLNNAVVWMASTQPLNSKSSITFSNPLITGPKAPITIGIIFTCMFHSFFNSLARSRYLSIFSHFFSFYSMVIKDSKVDKFAISFFFLLIITRSGLLPEIQWSFCMSKFHRRLCVLFSMPGAGLCIYHFLVWSNLNFLHISQYKTLPCLVWYYFCVNLLHSLVIWLMVSSLSPHSLNLLFCCDLSILALIWLVLMSLFCTAIRRDYVCLLKFPFLSHVQVLSCEMLFISRFKRP